MVLVASLWQIIAKTQGFCFHAKTEFYQAPVVQKLDSPIHWISVRETNCTIHWIEIYLLDSAIHLFNNWDQSFNLIHSSFPMIIFSPLQHNLQHCLKSVLFCHYCPLNPSTIDGCGKGASWNRRGPQASLEGNRDNPVRSTHQAPSHWEPQVKKGADTHLKEHPERREGWGRTNNCNYCTQKQRKQNYWPLRQHCKITKALLNAKTAPQTISGGDHWPVVSYV